MNNTTKLSEKLYKYRTFDKDGYYKRLLKNNELFFSSPKEFNDPFDCSSHVVLNKEVLQKALTLFDSRSLPRPLGSELLNSPEYKGEDFFNNQTKLGNLFKTTANQHGVCSLSEKYDNILMWSHYANCHKGFCAELDLYILSAFIINEKNNSEKIVIPGQVEYALDYPLIKDLSNPEETIKPVFQKFSDWGYEAEWRLLYINHPNECISFPEGVITAIYFGLECPKENIDEAWELVKDKDVKPIFYKMKKSLSQFALEFEELRQYR